MKKIPWLIEDDDDSLDYATYQPTSIQYSRDGFFRLFLMDQVILHPSTAISTASKHRLNK